MMSNLMREGRRPLGLINYLLLVVFLGSVLLATPVSVNAQRRESVALPVFLDVGGEFAGWPVSVSGGYTKAVVSEMQDDGTLSSMKHVANFEVEDLEVSFGVEMAPIWWQLVSQALGDRSGEAFDMAVISVDGDGRQVERYVLRQAIVTQVELPIFDATSREPGYFKAVISAGSSQYDTMGGQPGPQVATSARTWTRNAFRFELGDLPTGRTKSVVPPAISIRLASGSVGSFRETNRTPAGVSVGNMTVALARSSDEGQYFDWMRNFLINGNVSQDDELQSSLTVLGPDLQEQLMTIYFDQVGLVSIDPHLGATDGSQYEMQVELYVERVRLEGNW